MAFVADESFNARIVRGLKRRLPEIDIASLAEVGLLGADDPDVLAWAADAGRVVLTHDVSTMTRFAYERLARRQRMPGIVEVSTRASIGTAIQDLVLLATAGIVEDCDGQIIYLPL